MKANEVDSLDSSLAYLHQETLEWMKEIEFYLDEIKGFQHSIHRLSVNRWKCNGVHESARS